MIFRLEVEMNNGAFHDEPDELARIIRGVANSVSDDVMSGRVRDSYGNTVGDWRIS